MPRASIGSIRTVFDVTVDFEYKCTPRLRREVRQIIFEHFEQMSPHGASILEEIVQIKTKPAFAKAIETTPEALIVVMESGPVAIP